MSIWLLIPFIIERSHLLKFSLYKYRLWKEGAISQWISFNLNGLISSETYKIFHLIELHSYLIISFTDKIILIHLIQMLPRSKTWSYNFFQWFFWFFYSHLSQISDKNIFFLVYWLFFLFWRVIIYQNINVN